MCERTYWLDEEVDAHDGYGGTKLVHKKANKNEANLISSLTDSGLHMPAIDIDMEAQLLPSKTGGHWHLYINKAMSWNRYRHLLKEMVKCGIVEKGYYKAAVRDKQSFLRKPSLVLKDAFGVEDEDS